MAAVETETRTIAGTWNVDPVHSTVEFDVTDTEKMMATVRGRFTDFEGSLELNGEPSSWRAGGVIRTQSVTTDNEQRDNHLRSPDFFDAERFPEIRFESKSVERDGDRLRIIGTLTIKEVPNDVELAATIHGLGGDPQGAERIVLSAHGRFDWATTAVTLSTSISAVKA